MTDQPTDQPVRIPRELFEAAEQQALSAGLTAKAWIRAVVDSELERRNDNLERKADK